MTTCRIPVGCINVYTFRPPSAVESSFASFSMKDRALEIEPAPTPLRAKDLPCTALLLPALKPNVLYTEIDAHTSPFVANVPAHAPWYPSEDARVHVLNVLVQPTRLSMRTNRNNGAGNEIANAGVETNVENADVALAGGEAADAELAHLPGPVSNFVVVVRNRIFLKHADTQRENLGASFQNVVPWEEWGPRNSRWLQENNSNAWLRSVYFRSFTAC